MNTKLRVNINKQMNVVRHKFQFNKLNGELQAHRRNKFPKSSSDILNKDFTAILRTPNDMILTRINDIMIRFIQHECSIQILNK